MAQHFLLSAAARSLSPAKVMQMYDQGAENVFLRLRWPQTDGKPVCPNCGCQICYDCRRSANQRRWRCKACGSDFSVTSGTLFAWHKLPLKTYLMAIAVFCNDWPKTSWTNVRLWSPRASAAGARWRRCSQPRVTPSRLFGCGSSVGERLSSGLGISTLPFKLNQNRRHHIPRQQHKVTNWPAYEAGLRQRGSLTVWFTDEAVAAWAAAPRITRGGQPFYSPLAILTALTLRAVFRLAYRQVEGLIGSIINLLGLRLRVPDHTTLSRRSATLAVPWPQLNTGAADNAQPLHLLMDSTGLKLCGAGEWLVEKHGTRRRRAWRKLHLGVDANTGQIMAAVLTSKEVDDAAQVGPLLDQVTNSLASVTADGAYDQDSVYTDVVERHPDAAMIVPPRRTAVLSDQAATTPTQRDRHLQCIAETSRKAWQKASGYNKRAKVEAAIGRWKQVIGDGLRSRIDERRVTEVNVAVNILNCMLELGRPNYVRIV